MTLTQDVRGAAPAAPELPQESALAPQQHQQPGLVRAVWLALVRTWRQLTSMRTALLLLFLLAVAAIPGSVVPQRPISPQKVTAYLQEHPTSGPVLDRLGLFDVFGSVWFSAVYLLLFVSLVGCVLPRMRQHATALRKRPPQAPAHPARLREGATFTTGLSAHEATERSREVLRSARWRVALDSGGTSLGAEKGYLRETGNLVFHGALILLLAGVGLGSAVGYEGTQLVTEGGSLVNSPVYYNDPPRAGRLVDTDRLAPFSVQLQDFRAEYQDTGTPKSYAADVTWRPRPGAATQAAQIRVNHPLSVGGGTEIYLQNHGFAPHFVLRDATGAILFDEYVPCLPTKPQVMESACTVKVPDTGLRTDDGRSITPDGGSPFQLGFAGYFFPTFEQSPLVGVTSSFPAPNRPGMTLKAYSGNLGLNSGLPQSVFALRLPGLNELSSSFLEVGTPGKDVMGAQVLPGGLTLTVDGYREWVNFQVKRDPFKPLVLVAAILVITGLLATLRVRRRRLWVRVTEIATTPNGTTPRHTIVEVGALSRDGDDAALSAAFPDVVERLQDRLAAGERPGPTEPTMDYAAAPATSTPSRR